MCVTPAAMKSGGWLAASTRGTARGTETHVKLASYSAPIPG